MRKPKPNVCNRCGAYQDSDTGLCDECLDYIEAYALDVQNVIEFYFKYPLQSLEKAEYYENYSFLL